MGDLLECPQARTRQDPAHKQIPRFSQKKRESGAGQEEMRRLPAVERLERKDGQGSFENKTYGLPVLQILQQRRKPEQRNNLQLHRNHWPPQAMSSRKLPGSRGISEEIEKMHFEN